MLVAVALPALSMRLGLPDGATEPAGSTQNTAYLLTADKFGPGANGPLLVVATLPSGVSGDEILAQQVRVGSAVHGNGDVAAVAPIGQSADGRTLAFQVVPKDGPNSESTENLVRDLRTMSPLSDGTTLGVAGSASGNIDISEKLAEALPVYLAVVVGLSFVIMVLVFRSLLVPLTATLGFVLSLFAAFGGVVAIFQWGWLNALFHAQPGPILSFLPTLLVGILFGLAMDYQLFLVSGMREAHVHGAPARVAVRQGLSAGRVVVTAAAIIMISVFCRVRVLELRDHPAARVRPGLRRARRRLRRADAAHPGGHAPRRRRRMVAAAVARPDPAQRRRRGRRARAGPPAYRGRRRRS